MTYTDRCNLIRELRLDNLQNHIVNVGQDHLTFCGFFTERSQFEALAARLQANIDRAA